MRKMNFEQAPPEKRDVGGLSGKILLLIAMAACVLWAVFLQARL